MSQSRYEKLANVLVHHSCQLQSGEAVLIQATETDLAFIEVLIETVTNAGGIPVVQIGNNRLSRKILQHMPEAGFQLWGELDSHRMKKMQAFIGIRGGNNTSEMSDIERQQMNLFRQWVQEPVHMQIRVPKTKWVILRWPNPGMAQAAQMSTEAFEDFYFDVCTLDYGQMAKAVDPLIDLMTATDTVRIVGPNDTDLAFSIKDIPVIGCFGERNIPDGECFTAPVRDSVQGVMHYNTPTIYDGVSYQNVRLEFKDGKIVSASSEINQDGLDALLETDDGARYIGEFSLGFNPYIQHPMKDILFDEKIAGSLHFTPGQAYEIADNGNRSKIHWDMVLIQRPEYGGGEVYFDDRLIRKDGLFVIDELLGLNPDSLRS